MEMIEKVEFQLVLYLDKKWPKYKHLEAMIQNRWSKRPRSVPDDAC